MKVRRQLAALEPMILGPLFGINGDDWHRTVPGKWSLAQIVEHLGIGIDSVATAFEHRASKEPMRRRSTPGQAVARHLILGLGRLPRGRRPPEGTVPAERPDPQAAVAQFRMGVSRLETLVQNWPEKRQSEIFVRHPYLGDLNLPEWVRFFYVHCRHHAPQIRARLRWLQAKRAVNSVKR